MATKTKSANPSIIKQAEEVIRESTRETPREFALRWVAYAFQACGHFLLTGLPEKVEAEELYCELENDLTTFEPNYHAIAKQAKGICAILNKVRAEFELVDFNEAEALVNSEAFSSWKVRPTVEEVYKALAKYREVAANYEAVKVLQNRRR